MAANEMGFDPDLTTITPDNPFWDATDGAHPAYWRGNDNGAVGVAQRLKFIAETGEHAGTFGNAEIEESAQAILRARRAPDWHRLKTYITERVAESKRLERSAGHRGQDSIAHSHAYSALVGESILYEIEELSK